MVDVIREIVSGKKKRFKEEGFNLDLTYITDRIIAMSFPGSGFELVYRNNINDVGKLLDRKHGKKYLVLNLSGRKYDYEKFHFQVRDFPWEDHHSPPINRLFEACECIHTFLSSDVNNVVVIHCLAGKGRTGTIICCYLMYCGRFDNSDMALEYYKRKRFEKGGGVTQPSQIRYVKYFEKVLMGYMTSQVKLEPAIVLLDKLVMSQCPKTSSYFRPYVNVYTVRDNSVVFSTLDPEKKKSPKKFKPKKVEDKTPLTIDFGKNKTLLIGDVLLKVYHMATLNSKLAFRFAFNTAFLNIDSQNHAFGKNELDPDTVAKSEKYPSDFEVELHLTVVGKHLDMNNPDSVKHQKIHELEQPCWESVYTILKNHKTPSKKEASLLLFRDVDRDNVEIVIEKKKGDLTQYLQNNQDSENNEGADSGGDNSFLKEDEKSDGSGVFEDENKNDSESDNEIV